VRVALAASLLLASTAHADDHPRCNTISLEPLSLFYTRTVSIDAEREVAPRIGVALLAGVGRSTNVAIGDQIHVFSRGSSGDNLEDVRYTRLHAGVQGNYYSARFRGWHLGGELVYLHYGWATLDGENIHAITASAYVGWKWLWSSGVTAAVQGGLGFAGTDAGEMTGWHLDRGGTLGPVHLAASASVGYSF
jgi:hypothetical protein